MTNKGVILDKERVKNDPSLVNLLSILTLFWSWCIVDPRTYPVPSDCENPRIIPQAAKAARPSPEAAWYSQLRGSVKWIDEMAQSELS